MSCEKFSKISTITCYLTIALIIGTAVFGVFELIIPAVISIILAAVSLLFSNWANIMAFDIVYKEAEKKYFEFKNTCKENTIPKTDNANDYYLEDYYM